MNSVFGGVPVYVVRSVGASVIENWIAETSGHYLIVVQPLSPGDFVYSIQIDCEMCGQSLCPMEAPL